MPLQRDEFTSDSISELPSILAEEAVEAHVGAPGDGQKRFVDVCNLKGDSLWLLTPDCHDLTPPLTEVWYRCTIGDFVLDSLTGQSVLQDADAFTE